MIRIGVLGYGNLGRGASIAVTNAEDMELVAIFTRRNPEDINAVVDVPVINVEEVEKWKDKIDVMLLCGGSAKDLPEQGPCYAKMFNVVDSFDTHARIPEYYNAVDKSAKKGSHIAIISAGWDPGLFSINRLYGEAILPEGNTYTFWGPGVSQGHSDALREIDGVKYAVQYTIPIEKAIQAVRNGEKPNYTTREKHLRECFVVLEDGVDSKKIEKEIKEMPNYFADYDTTVHFISEEEFNKNHTKMPHGGFVIRSGSTGIKNENKEVMEFSLKLESNPEFDASVVVAYARAAYRLSKAGESGARTVFDIPPVMLSPKTREELIREIL